MKKLSTVSLQAMVAPSIDNCLVLKTEFSTFSTSKLSIDGTTIASKLTSVSFSTNYETKLIKRNHLLTVMVASSILEIPSLCFMCCLSIVYVYKECFTFVCDSTTSVRIIFRKL